MKIVRANFPGYALVPKSALEDQNLSLAAKGALCCLLGLDSFPPAVLEDEIFQMAVAQLEKARYVVKNGDTLIVRECLYAETAPVVTAEEEVKSNSCPMKKLVDLYHEHCPSLGRVGKIYGTNRERMLRSRWREQPTLEFWVNFFKRVEASDFLCGRVNPTPGRRLFVADFEWIVRPNNFAKIIEGKYDNKQVQAMHAKGNAVPMTSEAMAAWSEFFNKIRKDGAYAVLEDPVTIEVVEAMGGLNMVVSSLTSREIHFRRADFVKLYNEMKVQEAVLAQDNSWAGAPGR